MSTPLDNKDLKDLATRLIKEGPHKTYDASPRRIRIVFNGEYITDTRNAKFVWEHPYYPQLYVPWSDMLKQFGEVTEEDRDLGFNLISLTIGGKTTSRIIVFFPKEKRPELEQMVRIEFKSVDAWYEEDTPILIHPKDPFKRVDVLPSSAAIKVALQGITLAEAPFSMHLYETGLPVRYYLPLTSIGQENLRPSAKGTKTQCPYKGEAEYYDIVLKDASGKEQVFPDLVWYYNSPNLECAGIKGLACFYNEKVELSVDGKKEDQPKTHFA